MINKKYVEGIMIHRNYELPEYKFKPTVKYEITIGVLEGYNFDKVTETDIYTLIDTALEKWKEYAAEFYSLTDIYISAIGLYQCSALYNEAWGCPKYGEPIVRFDCTLNPEFVKNPNIYEDGIIYISKKLQEFFKQYTVNITKIHQTSVCYLKKEED